MKGLSRVKLNKILVGLGSVALMGCLQAQTPLGSGTTASNGTGNSLGFNGASGAINIGATQVQVSWVAGTSPNITGYTVYDDSTGTPATLAVVTKTTTSYTHFGLTAGNLKSYIVRAIDGSGQTTDSNNVIVSAFTYGGLTSATAGGTYSSPTLQVVFPSPGVGALESHVYLNYRGLGKQLVAKISSATTGAVNTPYTLNMTVPTYAAYINPGTKYTVSVLALSSANFEDDNTVTNLAETPSWLNAAGPATYNGVSGVKAYGAAPNAPVAPTAVQTTISWPPFTGSTAATQYALIRTQSGTTLDASTTTICTASTTTSCLVACSGSNSSNASCGANTYTVTQGGLSGIYITDTTVNDPNSTGSKVVYDYAVTDYYNGWLEEFPSANSPAGGVSSVDTPYRVTVDIPPKNMVLVQRNAANYEMCSLMGKATDPMNYNRCSYSGRGAVPFNSGPGNAALGLNANYYDFGYSLLVDRWELGCNYTAGEATTAWPAGGAGNNGDVWYNTNVQGCGYKDPSAGWVVAWSPTVTSNPASLQAVATNDPHGTNGQTHIPPLAYLSQQGSWNACQAFSNTDGYGAKRLMRRREFVAMAAGPWINGDPGQMTDAQIANVEGDGNISQHHCDSQNMVSYGAVGDGGNWVAPGTTNPVAAPFNVYPTYGQGPFADIAGQSLIGVNDAAAMVNIGSSSTSSCVSRYGVQDYIANIQVWVSDYMDNCDVVSGAGYKCSHDNTNALGLDSGNTDLNGFNFDGLMGPGSDNPNDWAVDLGAPTLNATYFNLALGMAYVNNYVDGADNHTQTPTLASVSAKVHHNLEYFDTKGASSGSATRGWSMGGTYWEGGGAGRWSDNPTYAPGTTSLAVGTRCAVPTQ